MGRTLVFSLLQAFLLMIMSVNLVYAQEDITAVYDENDSTLTITNNSDKIVILKKEGLLAPYYKKANHTVESDGEFKSSYLLSTIAPSVEFQIPKGRIKNGNTIICHLYKGKKRHEARNIPITIKPAIVKTKVVVPPKPEDKLPWWIYISGIFVILFLFWIIFFISKRSKQRKGEKSIPPEENLLTVVEEESTKQDEYPVGLNEVRRDISNYYTVDASQIYADTAIREILISRQAVKSMYDHFKKSLESDERTVETGCYFIGRWEYAGQNSDSYNISLEYIVEPGDDAVFGEYELRFGYYINSEVHTQTRVMSAKTKCDYVHVAWMHSHPGHGLFLSEHDLNVQKGLVYSDAKNRMLAIVLDTNTPAWRMAFFTPRHDGSMNNIKIGENFKTYSLDDLYEWSKKPSEATFAGNIAGLENYFKLPSGTADPASVFFAAKAINNIDDILYTSDKGLVGYLSGIIQTGYQNRQNIIIEECSSLQNSGTLGCLIADSATVYMEILNKYDPVISNCRFFIVYRSDNEMIISLKNEAMKYPPEEGSLIRFSLKEMKEWTRRRRN
jgi:proteasome lid subunit RPN8/RPN11